MKTPTLLLAALAASTIASAQTATWEGGSLGNGSGFYWGDAGNWSDGASGSVSVPNSTTSTAYINNDFINSGSQRTLLLANSSGVDSSFTIKTLQYSTSTSSNRSYTISNLSGGTGALVFDSGVPLTAATLVVYSGSGNQHTINSKVQLNSDLEIRIGSNSAGTTNILTVINGSISGSGGITTNSGNVYRIAFAGANSYTGETDISFGHFIVTGAGTLGNSDTNISSGATLTLESATSLNDSFGLFLAGGSTVNLNFTGADTIGALSIAGSAIASGTYDVSALNGFAQSFTGGDIFAGTGSLTIAATIPEPATVSMLAGLVILGLSVTRRRNRRA